MTLNEEHIKQINVGNVKAFREVYDEMYHSLCLYAYKILPQQDIVLDMVQETFVIFWDKRKEFTSLLGTKSYLYTVVRNKMINQMKLNHTISMESIQIEEPVFENQITKEETFKLLYLALEQLPQQTRKVVKLTLTGHSNQEIADELSISINSVKTLKKSGYTKLRELLKNQIFLLLYLSTFFTN